jgi:hypothetical protein
LCAWLDSDEQNWERLFEYVYRKAISPHFGFFKLIIELVDGPIDPDDAPGRILPDEQALDILSECERIQGVEAA